MKFRLTYKKLGVKSTTIFSEFSYPENIKDVCFVNDVGFLCLGDNSLIQVTEKDCRIIAPIDNPMSICKGAEGYVYVSYGGGIRGFNYLDGYYHHEVLSSEELEVIYRPLKKIGVKDISIHAHDNLIGLAVAPLNKIFILRKGSIYRQYGSGIPVYGLASNMQLHSIHNPKGIWIYNGATFFVSDTNNGCIRSFGDLHRIITGNPLELSIYPTKILVDNKKGILYYLSKNYLRSVTIEDGKDIMLYENEHVLSMSMIDDKIYVLEGEK